MNGISLPSSVKRYKMPWELFLNFDEAEDRELFQTWLEDMGMEEFERWKEACGETNQVST
jgi:hypothetical protein